MNTAAAFDSLAASYDAQWTNAVSGRLQRDAVWRVLDSIARPGMCALDLGCGTGEDALHLAALGLAVEAIDVSPAMVAIARAKGVSAKAGDISEDLGLDGAYDLVLSNFGALNCLSELDGFAANLAHLVKSGGVAVLCLLNTFCAWETAFYISRGEWEKSIRRLRGNVRAKIGVQVRYYSARELRNALSSGFALSSDIGIGVCVPPSYVPPLPPRWLDRCIGADRAAGATFCGRMLADHRLFVFTRN